MRQSGNTYSAGEGKYTVCMSAVLADDENHNFLVGTHSLKHPGEIHHLKFSEDSNRVDCQHVYSLPGKEIWQIEASPYRAD